MTLHLRKLFLALLLAVTLLAGGGFIQASSSLAASPTHTVQYAGRAKPAIQHYSGDFLAVKKAAKAE